MDKFVIPIRSATVPTRYLALSGNPFDRWAVYSRAIELAPTTVFRSASGFTTLIGGNNISGYIRPNQAPFQPGECIDMYDDAGNYVVSGTPLHIFALIDTGAREIPTVATFWTATTDFDTTTLTWNNQPNMAGWIAKRLIINSSDTHGCGWLCGVRMPIERDTYGWAITAEGDGPVGAISEATCDLTSLYLVCKPALIGTNIAIAVLSYCTCVLFHR